MTVEELGGFAAYLEPSARVIVRKGTWGPRAITFGNRIYVRRDIAENWTADGLYPLIAHECGHVRQYRWCGLGIHPLAGIPVFFLLYGLVFLPVLVAWVRYRFELAAEVAAWNYVPQAARADRCDAFVDDLCSVKYFWPVPRCWARWGFRRKLW